MSICGYTDGEWEAWIELQWWLSEAHYNAWWQERQDAYMKMQAQRLVRKAAERQRQPEDIRRLVLNGPHVTSDKHYTGKRKHHRIGGSDIIHSQRDKHYKDKREHHCKHCKDKDYKDKGDTDIIDNQRDTNLIFL